MESYAAGETTTPLLEETIGANLARTAARFPDHEALVEVATGRRWTWAELDHDIDALARGLLAAGLAKGDRAGIWAPNCAEWTLVQYATARIGVILVNVNPSYRTHELAYALEHSGVRLLLSATAFRTSDYRGMIEQVAPDCPALGRTVYVDTDDWAALVAEGEALGPDALAERAATLGVIPFLIGDVVKAAFAAALLPLSWRALGGSGRLRGPGGPSGLGGGTDVRP